MIDWTAIIWKLIIAIAPIIAGVTMNLVQNFILTRSEAIQEKIRTAIADAIKTAQHLEPDPVKRKAWVVAQIMHAFPKLEVMYVSQLVESILVDYKLEYEHADWKTLSETGVPPS